MRFRLRVYRVRRFPWFWLAYSVLPGVWWLLPRSREVNVRAEPQELPCGITKRLDATWATGTNQVARPPAHEWRIRRSDIGGGQ
jgi:hypothetical protein